MTRMKRSFSGTKEHSSQCTENDRLDKYVHPRGTTDVVI